MRKIILFLFIITTHSYANTFNLTTNPLGYFVGVYQVNLDYIFNKHFSLGPLYASINVDALSTSMKGKSIGARARFYLNEATVVNSWVLTLEGGSLKTDIEHDSFLFFFSSSCPDKTTGSANGSFYGALIGYFWSWENFNMHLGFGVVHYAVDLELDSPTSSISAPLDGTGFAGDFSLGLAF